MQCQIDNPDKVEVFYWNTWASAASSDPDIILIPLDWTGESIWRGYGAPQPWAMPEGLVREYDITLGDNLVVVYSDPADDAIVYVLRYDTLEITTDLSGKHSGQHPCAAFKMLKTQLDGWLAMLKNFYEHSPDSLEEDVVVPKLSKTEYVCGRCGESKKRGAFTAKQLNKASGTDLICRVCMSKISSDNHKKRTPKPTRIKEWIHPEHADREGYIYFLQAEHDLNLIKIGFSINLENRLRSLKAQSAVPVKCLGVLSGKVALEKSLQLRFSEYKHHYEWFYPCMDLLELIQTLEPYIENP